MSRKSPRTWLAPVLLAVLLLLAGSAPAAEPRSSRQEAGKKKARPAHRGKSRSDARQKWNKLSDARKKQLMERYRRWKKLTPTERKRIRKTYEKMKGRGKSGGKEPAKTSSERRERLLANYKRWASLPVEKRRRYLQMHRAFRSVPRRRLDSILTMKEPARAKALQKVFQAHRLNGLTRHFSPSERSRLKGRKGDERTALIRRILKERQEQQAARIPGAVRERLAKLPPADRGKTLRKELGKVFYRDQMILALLSGRDRRAFRALPIRARDGWAQRKLAAAAPALAKTLPEAERRRLSLLSPSQRNWKLAEHLFRRKMASVTRSLEPWQRKELGRLDPLKRIERAQHFLRQNHGRLLRALPSSLRAQLKGKKPHEQRKAVNAYILSRIPRDLWKRFSREERIIFQRLPLLEKLRAVRRLESGRRKK